MIQDLVTQLYGALATGDRAAIERLISHDFVADFSPGYGAPIAGRHVGAEAIDQGWWELGRRWKVKAEPDEYIRSADGRLVVIGTYRGRLRRPEGDPFEAPFAHVWAAEGEHLTRLVQVTDTRLWGGN